MSNKEVIENKVKLLGLDLGCYNNIIEKIGKKELSKILNELDQEYTDVVVNMRGKIFVVEIATVDREKDFDIKNKAEYIDLYGDEKFDEVL